MEKFIKTILPRIKTFSESLNQKALFADQPWIFIDQDGNRHTYIFKRDNSLIMSFNGSVQVGRWEYLPEVKSLLIDRIKDKILLNQGFVDKGIMLLKQDGTEDIWPLINQNIIPDLNGENYLRQIASQKLGLITLNIQGKWYYYAPTVVSGIQKDTAFYDESLQPTEDSFTLIREGTEYEISRGIVRNSYKLSYLQSTKGQLLIKCKDYYIQRGAEVFLQNEVAPDEIYSIKNDAIKSICVRNGKIEEIAFAKTKEHYVILFIIIGVFIAALYTIFSGKTAEESSTSNGVRASEEITAVTPDTFQMVDTLVTPPTSSDKDIAPSTIDTLLNQSTTTSNPPQQTVDINTILSTHRFAYAQVIVQVDVPHYSSESGLTYEPETTRWVTNIIEFKQYNDNDEVSRFKDELKRTARLNPRISYGSITNMQISMKDFATYADASSAREQLTFSNNELYVPFSN